MMNTFILFFIAFDPWRILLPAGLSMILLVSHWLGKADEQSPYFLVERVLSRLTGHLAMWLFILTGVFGLLLPWLVGDPLEGYLARGKTIGLLEMVMYGSGVYCLWKVKDLSAQGKESKKHWMWGSCFLFFLVLILWILKWDDFVFGGSEAVKATGFSWDWTRNLVRAIHMLLSAMAAGGLVVVLMGYLPWSCGLGRNGHPSINTEREGLGRIQIVRFGLAWILGGIVPQVVVGSWLLVALGENVRSHFLNGQTLESFVFFGSLLIALLGLVLMNAAFIAPHVKGLVWGGWVNILVAILLMGFIRSESYRASLESLNAEIQWASLGPGHLMVGVLLMLGLLGFLVKGLRPTLLVHSRNLTE